jgi:hypothetical protein
LFTISRDEILKLEESSTNWLRFFKFIAEQEYIKMEKRIFILQKESAEKRYEALLTNQPTYILTYLLTINPSKLFIFLFRDYPTPFKSHQKSISD